MDEFGFLLGILVRIVIIVVFPRCCFKSALLHSQALDLRTTSSFAISITPSRPLYLLKENAYSTFISLSKFI